MTIDPPRSPAIRLVCLPHAGGAAASYRSWRSHLDPRIDIRPAELPPALGGSPGPDGPLDRLVRSLADMLDGDRAATYALFGHSIGAVAAFECIRELRRRGHPEPRRLFVAASRPPAEEAAAGRGLHLLPDDRFLRAVSEMGGLPPDAVTDPDVRDVVLPKLRADYAMAETYQYEHDAPLRCPIVAYGGDRDPYAGRQEISRWAEYTTGPTRVHILAGDHFFVDGQRSRLLRSITGELLGPQADPAT